MFSLDSTWFSPTQVGLCLLSRGFNRQAIKVWLAILIVLLFFAQDTVKP